MRKKKPKDYRPFKEKFRDFMYHKPWKVLLYSFIVAVVIFVVGWLTNNEAGTVVIFTYPVSLIFYVLELTEEKRFRKHDAEDSPHALPFLHTVGLWAFQLVVFLGSYLNR